VGFPVAVPLFPWDVSHFRLVDLMSLLQIYAHEYIELAETIGVMRALIFNGGQLSPDQWRALHWAVRKAKEASDTLGLTLTSQQCHALLMMFESKITFPEDQTLSQMFGEMTQRMRGELERHAFFYLDANLKDYYSEQQFSPQAVENFPSATDDMLEAGKCYALSRHTASVFHLSRIVEVGLRVLTSDIGGKLRHDWGAQLQEIEKELEKRYKAAGARTADEQFYSEAAAQIGHIKNAWRNPTMHIERRYSEEIAGDIFSAVKAFMRALATKLKE
jgi:hypothetical protein